MDKTQAKYDNHITHKEYDILYALSIITSVILAGVSEAVIKCEKFHGPPLCIQQGGAASRQVQKPQGQAQGQGLAQAQQPQPEINSKWMNTFMNLAGIVNDKLHTIFENVSIHAIDTVEEYALGDLGTKQSDKKILEQLQIKTMVLGKMTRDPEVQKALKDLAEELSILSIQMLDTMKPTIDRMTDKAFETLNRSATKATEGIMNTGMNIIVSTISLIPIYGGIISLIASFLRGFNSAMLSAAPGVEFSTEAFFTALNTSIRMLQDFLKVQPRLTQEANAVRTAVQNIIPSASDISAFTRKGRELGNAYALSAAKNPLSSINKSLSAAKNPLSSINKSLSAAKNPLSAANTLSKVNPLKLKQQGGRAKIQRKIQHITKRLKHTINRFTNNRRFTKKFMR
jgi:hypothetical protein